MVGSKLTMTLEQAADRLGFTPRWMYHHWPELEREGVIVYRVPKGSPNGRLFFRIDTIERYLDACRIKTSTSVFN